MKKLDLIRKWICLLSLAIVIHCGALMLSLKCNISDAVSNYISNLTEFTESVADMQKEKEDRNILPQLMECERVNHKKAKKR